MSGTIAWNSDPVPNWPDVEWRHTLKGTRLKPGVRACAVRAASGASWYGEINGHRIDRIEYPTMRACMSAVERVLLRMGWLVRNGKWSAQAEYDRTWADAARRDQASIARWSR